MEITVDRGADAAYICLVRAKPGSVESSYIVNRSEVPGQRFIVLDFDADNRLIGIEVLGASHALPEEFLAEAEVIG